MEGDFIKINEWLTPLSWLYGLGVGIRNQMFELGILKSRSFKVPVIAVGNITVGGTGKTPHTEMILRKLLENGRDNLAVLSRGYKRKSKGFQLAGAEATSGDGYPAWKMKANSELQKIVRESYVKLFGKEPIVRGIHAGLECGLFSERYPQLDMVSFGPTLRFVHTPDERLLIPTVQMVWDHLLDVLKNIPQK